MEPLDFEEDCINLHLTESDFPIQIKTLLHWPFLVSNWQEHFPFIVSHLFSWAAESLCNKESSVRFFGICDSSAHVLDSTVFDILHSHQ